MCEQDTRIEEVVLRAVQRLGFADLRPQQMEAIKQGKDVFISLPTGYGKSLIYSVLPYAYDELRGCRGSICSLYGDLIVTGPQIIYIIRILPSESTNAPFKVEYRCYAYGW